MILIPWGFPCGSAVKESTCNAGDLDSIPGLGRSPGEGKGYPFQSSGLENSMDCIVHSPGQKIGMGSLSLLQEEIYSPWGLYSPQDCVSSWGHKESDTTEWLFTFIFTDTITTDHDSRLTLDELFSIILYSLIECHQLHYLIQRFLLHSWVGTIYNCLWFTWIVSYE